MLDSQIPKGCDSKNLHHTCLARAPIKDLTHTKEEKGGVPKDIHVADFICLSISILHPGAVECKFMTSVGIQYVLEKKINYPLQLKGFLQKGRISLFW